jgi:hypothetical protein
MAVFPCNITASSQALSWSGEINVKPYTTALARFYLVFSTELAPDYVPIIPEVRIQQPYRWAEMNAFAQPIRQPEA